MHEEISMNGTGQTIDLAALKFNQSAIAVLVVGGFILDTPLLPAFVAAVMILGTFDQRLALFKQTYRHVVAPLNLMEPRLVKGPAAPHEFAQLLGGIMLAAGAVLLWSGFPVAGWLLSWIVALLAGVNLALGFCAGCFLYYQLGRMGVRGFRAPREKGRHNALAS
jgi:hypothetical protein